MLEPKLITTEKDLDALRTSLQLDGFVDDKTSENYEFIMHRQLWTANRCIIVALREQSRRSQQSQYYGYVACIPLRDDFIQNVVPQFIKSRQSIRAHLKPEFVLPENEALSKAHAEGNALFVGLTARANEKISFPAISSQLFLNIEERRKELRARIVLAEAVQLSYKAICTKIGCRTLYQTNDSTDIYYFDVGLLGEQQSLGTNLDEILLHLWGLPNILSLNLSKKQRMIARLLIDGVIGKNLADELLNRFGVKMATSTALDHVKKIKNRFHNAFPDRTGTRALLCYLTANRFEFCEPKKLSDLILLSTSEFS